MCAGGAEGAAEEVDEPGLVLRRGAEGRLGVMRAWNQPRLIARHRLGHDRGEVRPVVHQGVLVLFAVDDRERPPADRGGHVERADRRGFEPHQPADEEAAGDEEVDRVRELAEGDLLADEDVDVADAGVFPGRRHRRVHAGRDDDRRRAEGVPHEADLRCGQAAGLDEPVACAEDVEVLLGSGSEPAVLVGGVAHVPQVDQQDPEACPVEHPGMGQDDMVPPAGAGPVDDDHGGRGCRPAADPPGAERPDRCIAAGEGDLLEVGHHVRSEVDPATGRRPEGVDVAVVGQRPPGRGVLREAWLAGAPGAALGRHGGDGVEQDVRADPVPDQRDHGDGHDARQDPTHATCLRDATASGTLLPVGRCSPRRCCTRGGAAADDGGG